jgi:hypothetical protein
VPPWDTRAQSVTAPTTAPRHRRRSVLSHHRRPLRHSPLPPACRVCSPAPAHRLACRPAGRALARSPHPAAPPHAQAAQDESARRLRPALVWMRWGGSAGSPCVLYQSQQAFLPLASEWLRERRSACAIADGRIQSEVWLCLVSSACKRSAGRGQRSVATTGRVGSADIQPPMRPHQREHVNRSRPERIATHDKHPLRLGAANTVIQGSTCGRARS